MVRYGEECSAIFQPAPAKACYISSWVVLATRSQSLVAVATVRAVHPAATTGDLIGSFGATVLARPNASLVHEPFGAIAVIALAGDAIFAPWPRLRDRRQVPWPTGTPRGPLPYLSVSANPVESIYGCEELKPQLGSGSVGLAPLLSATAGASRAPESREGTQAAERRRTWRQMNGATRTGTSILGSADRSGVIPVEVL